MNWICFGHLPRRFNYSLHATNLVTLESCRHRVAFDYDITDSAKNQLDRPYAELPLSAPKAELSMLGKHTDSCCLSLGHGPAFSCPAAAHAYDQATKHSDLPLGRFISVS